MGYYYVPANGQEGQGGFWYGPPPPGGYWYGPMPPPTQPVEGSVEEASVTEDEDNEAGSFCDGESDGASIEENPTMESRKSGNKSTSQKHLVDSHSRRSRH